MSDIVEELVANDCFWCKQRVRRAADEIDRLRAALEWIAGTALTEPEEMVEKARAALGEKA